MNSPGMFYSYQVTDLKGYTNAWEASFVQTLWVSAQANMETTPATSWNILVPSPAMQDTGNFAALDTDYPYRNWFQDDWDSEHDTPRSALRGYENYVWRKDKFWSYLMWQPKRRPGSIPVPLKLYIWTWRGATGKTNDAAWPWRLNGWSNQRGGSGWDEYVHPIWQTNVVAAFERRETNNYHYATPTP
jgi:hypothetical protein